MRVKSEFVPCPHDIDALLQKVREYMPGLTNGKGGLVWCDDCRHWVPFDWIERPDGKGVLPTPDGEVNGNN